VAIPGRDTPHEFGQLIAGPGLGLEQQAVGGSKKFDLRPFGYSHLFRQSLGQAQRQAVPPLLYDRVHGVDTMTIQPGAVMALLSMGECVGHTGFDPQLLTVSRHISQAGAAGTEVLSMPRGAADHDLGQELVAPACEIYSRLRREMAFRFLLKPQLFRFLSFFSPISACRCSARFGPKRQRAAALQNA
jgi:hypothetical protein